MKKKPKMCEYMMEELSIGLKKHEAILNKDLEDSEIKFGKNSPQWEENHIKLIGFYELFTTLNEHFGVNIYM